MKRRGTVRWRSEAAPLASDAPALVSFTRRVTGALFLQPWAYAEVAADRHALPHAVAVVLVAALARDAYRFSTLWQVAGMAAVWFGLLVGVVSWLMFTAFTFPIVRWMCGASAHFAPLIRCLGFAESPWLFMIPAALWPLGDAAIALLFGVTVWQYPAIALAIRAAAGCSTRRAFAAAAASYGGYIALGVWLRSLPA